MDLVKAGAGGHIDLTADNRLDPLRLAGAVEINDTVHDTVVCNGHSSLTQFLDVLHQLFNATGAVQKRKFRMKM